MTTPRRERRMSLGQHLRELRRRAGIAAIGLLVGGIAGWFLASIVWEALRIPVAGVTGAHAMAAINYPSITGAFDLRIQTALCIGIVLSCPVWLYQVLAFVVPGLSRRESGYVLGFLLSAVPLFLLGCVAGWMVLPHVVQLMLGFAPAQDTTLIDARQYYEFAMKLVVATGIAFVAPVFLVLLNFMGIIAGRSILRGWRWAILGACIFSAIATPAADVLSMFLLAVPMIALFFAAVGVALIHDRAVARRTARLDAELDAAERPEKEVAS